MTQPCPDVWPDVPIVGVDPGDALHEDDADPAADVDHEPCPDAGDPL